jgi:hypothetical protein
MKGEAISLQLESPKDGLVVEWSASLRKDANYVRQKVSVNTARPGIWVKEFVVVDLSFRGSHVIGRVAGSPVTYRDLFFASEHPASASVVKNGRVRCSLKRKELAGGASPHGEDAVAAVWGVAPPSQMRRSFLYYLERERAHPYRPFLAYNSWYDIAREGKSMTEAECLEVIEHFGREFIEKRGAVMDSFVYDDGWDAPMWRFSDDFPNGFRPLAAAAQKYDSAVGAWLSPWGGYGERRGPRFRYATEQGYKRSFWGLSIAGPKYYARFRDACVDMVKNHGLNFLKFDGFEAGNLERRTNAAMNDQIEAMLHLIRELRRVKPDLFISVTIGSWPSPFWLHHADSVWRGGEDYGFRGVGTTREQGITFRDAIVFEKIVRRAPLYPLSSLMILGVVYAPHGAGAEVSNELEGFTHDVRSYFASGTHLQELHIRPQMMTPKTWDVLAEAAGWARRNADVLVDTHWVGGDPGEGEVYGHASWSPRKGILFLRNPSDRPSSIALDVARAFELPEGAPQAYELKVPWRDDAGRSIVRIEAGVPHAFVLAPFEVLVFDARPVR